MCYSGQMKKKTKKWTLKQHTSEEIQLFGHLKVQEELISEINSAVYRHDWGMIRNLLDEVENHENYIRDLSDMIEYNVEFQGKSIKSAKLKVG